MLIDLIIHNANLRTFFDLKVTNLSFYTRKKLLSFSFQHPYDVAAASMLTSSIIKIALDKINSSFIWGFIFSFHTSTLLIGGLLGSDVGLSIAQELLHMNKSTPIEMTTRYIASSLVQLTSISIGKIIYNKRHLLGI